jgi:hypothetical protein
VKGTSYGETDEIGENAVVDRHHLRDPTPPFST